MSKNNITNMNGLFKEIYSDLFRDMFSNFEWIKKEKKLYYQSVLFNTNIFLGLSKSLEPQIEEVNTKTLILELE